MKRTLLSILLTTCMLLSACGITESSKSTAVNETTVEESSAITFTDDLGREVTVSDPQRVAALLGSFAQIWMLAGGDVIATADDAWDDLSLELSEETVNLGNTKQLSLEQLLAADPDFILASINTRQNIEWQETLDATGIPTAYFDVSDFEDYLRLLSICTNITGRKDCFEQYGSDVATHIENVLAKSKKRLEENNAPTVLSMVASASSIFETAQAMFAVSVTWAKPVLKARTPFSRAAAWWWEALVNRWGIGLLTVRGSCL